jgi:hypothetical protein
MKRRYQNREEDQIAAGLMEWVYLNEGRFPFLRLFHKIDNEGKRNPKYSGTFGIRAGLPDYHLPVSDGTNIGFWLELKASGKEPTKKQRDMMALLHLENNVCIWVDNLYDAILSLEIYCIKVSTWKRRNLKS